MTDAMARVVKEVAIACDGRKVTLELICHDEYGAQILFDDARSRLKSDDGMVLYLKVKDLQEAGPTP